MPFHSLKVSQESLHPVTSVGDASLPRYDPPGYDDPQVDTSCRSILSTIALKEYNHPRVISVKYATRQVSLPPSFFSA